MYKRQEWVKLSGILLGKQQEADQLFDTQVQRVAPLENQQPTGKTVAFFSRVTCFSCLEEDVRILSGTSLTWMIRIQCMLSECID